MSERVDLREFVGAFVVEAEELVGLANAALLDIEAGNATNAARPKAVRDLFRALHTIKGLAAMIGVEPIVEIAHALESLVRAADRGSGELHRGAVDISLQGVRAIADRVRAVAEDRAVEPAPPQLVETITACSPTAETATPPPPVASSAWDARLANSERQHLGAALRAGTPVWSLVFVPSDAHASAGITIATVRARLAELGEIVKVAPRTLRDASGAQTGLAFDILVASTATPEHLAETVVSTVAEVVPLPPPPEAAPPPPPTATEPPPSATTTDTNAIGRSIVRVDLSRLDELQDQLALMIVSRFRLEREVAAIEARGTGVRRLREIVDQQARQLRDLRRALLKARMVRVAEVLEPLALLVRSLSRSSHKEVRLELDARDAELDKTVADRLLPAMVHLVRNAVDHALEPPAERAAAGKPAVGVIRVSCAQVSGTQLELVIADDGRGIDRAAIAQRARRAIVDDAALLDAITTPGFSTRDTVSHTSGRGLGMDIVRRIAVTELGGDLALQTAVGQGTTFTMRVPLTIAIVDVFSFECGTQPFVVPVAAIDEIFELDNETIAGLGTTATTATTQRARVSLVERRGAPMPVMSLGAILAIDSGANAKKALVTRRNGELVAFAVDRMLGRHEVVVRPIDDPLVDSPGIAGATDLGDGRPTLVLDLGELALGARQGEAS